MDKSEGRSFGESYSELLKRRRTSNDPAEEADGKRKLLLLTCQESTKTLDTKSTSIVFEKYFQTYTLSTSNGKLFEDKQLKIENKGLKLRSNLSNSKSLSGLLKSTIIKSSGLEKEYADFRRVFNSKSDYFAANKINKNKKYVNPLCAFAKSNNDEETSGASTSRGFDIKPSKQNETEGSFSKSTNNEKTSGASTCREFDIKPSRQNEASVLKSKNDEKTSGASTSRGFDFKPSRQNEANGNNSNRSSKENVFVKSDDGFKNRFNKNLESERENQFINDKSANIENQFKQNAIVENFGGKSEPGIRISSVDNGSRNYSSKTDNQLKFSSEDWLPNFENRNTSAESGCSKFTEKSSNVIPLKQINKVNKDDDDEEMSEARKNKYSFKKYNYKRNNDDDEDDLEDRFKPKKTYYNRKNTNDDEDDFKSKRKFNNRFNKDDDDGFNTKKKFNKKNKADDDEDEDDPNSYYNKKKRNAELYKRRFKKFEEEEEEIKKAPVAGFKTAREEFNIQYMKKHGTNAPALNPSSKKRLGLRGPSSKFVSPMIQRTDSDENMKSDGSSEPVDERLKNIDPKMVGLIMSEIMDFGPKIDWNDIAGLQFAKTAIQEAVVWPMLRPDIFTGLRRPPKGILLFGPPGTGKTLIGKCVASQSQSTFFSISASSLTSKWIGDGEKMVRALFAVARCHQPAVIFIDEIDSLLSQRSDSEHESSRRIKTEFLVQLDGATTDNEERLLLIGATNRPQELDEAARRRFVKRLYIPLPEFEARLQLVQRLMTSEKHSLNEDNAKQIANLSEGYSGADMRNLCADACMGPIRSIDISQIQNIQAQEVRPVSMEDFSKSLNRVRPSVSSKDLDQYVVWDNTYGSGAF